MTQEGSNPDSSSARRFESIKEKASGKSLDLSKAFISSVFNIFSWGGLYQNAVLHIGVNTCELPAGFSANPFCVVIHLILIAVELFVLLGGYPAVGGYPLGHALCAVRIHRLYGRGDGAHPFL